MRLVILWAKLNRKSYLALTKLMLYMLLLDETLDLVQQVLVLEPTEEVNKRELIAFMEVGCVTK